MAAVADGEAGRVRVPCARALHGFQGQAEHELDFSAGVSIMLLRRIDENWLEGKLDGKIGIFPANHVKIEVGSPSVTHQSVLASSGKPYAIALHSFQGTQGGDLGFNKGDLIELLGDIDESAWMKGRLGANTGIFPGSFVEVLRYPVEKVTAISWTNSHDLPDDGTRRIPKPRPSQNKSHPPTISEAGHDETNSVSSSPPVPSPALPSPYQPQHMQQTPTRSAPAPPTSNQTPHTSSHIPPPGKKYGTLPHPIPRKPRPRYPSATTTSSSSLSSSSSSSQLQSELAIERKLLESAEGLLAAGHLQQSEARTDKIKQAIHSHKNRISHLMAQIEEVKGNKVEEIGNATSPLPPPRPALPVSSKEQQRLKVIDELIMTERDFHHQMDICAYRVLPALRQVEGVQADHLFGNIEEVAELSGKFLAALEQHSSQDKKKARVGGVFTTFAPRMKAVFGTYCRNHDAASALYDKHLDTPSVADNIRHCMDLLRGEIQAWDLQSLLIKPVQRVLKYPLLLSQLVRNTGDSHPDYRDVHTAQEAMGKVAQDINEIKRRKELVVKYTASKEERKGSVSFHSLQKKMRRIQQSITQSAGLRPKTIDPKFDELEQKVLAMDLLVHGLIRDIAGWQDELQCVVDSHVTLAEGMNLLCSTTFLTRYKAFLPKVQGTVKTQAQFVKDHVSIPLESLEGLFQSPFLLVQKRKDKLLDYDRLQYVLDHADDSEKIAQLREDVLLARRNYEALNMQLLEELPQFLQAVTSMLEHLLRVLLQAQHSFTTVMSGLLQSLLSTSSSELSPLAGAPASSSAELQQNHAEQLSTICKDLIKLSLVPASIAMSFSLRATGVIPARKTSDANREEVSTSAANQVVHAESRGSQSSSVTETSVHYACVSLSLEKEEEEEEERVENGEDKGRDIFGEVTSLRVLYDFDAQDSAELSVVAGQSVRLLCGHDRLGCKDWWLVQDTQQDTQQGYVPATYLTPLMHQGDS